jgi:hypothetical protein
MSFPEIELLQGRDIAPRQAVGASSFIICQSEREWPKGAQ